jgi:hypothetical protein
MNVITKELQLAIEEVSKEFPTLAIVSFNKYGQWNYADANFESFIFNDNINQEILEKASDSIKDLPFIVHI